jgi:hypothetical protein
MFVRWQSRRSSAPPWWRSDAVNWAAILVEADGTDGEPRQIAYLGEIAESEISDVATQCGFWERVTRILDDLGDCISAEDRQHIEKAIAHKVPCPTEKQYRLWKAQIEAVLGQGSVTPVLWHWPCNCEAERKC